LKNPEEFCNAIKFACNSSTFGSVKGFYGLQYQEPRHYTETAIYIQRNGCVTEITPNSDSLKHFNQINPSYVNDLIQTLEDSLKRLKEYQSKNKI
jgi:hypothetical protein